MTGQINLDFNSGTIKQDIAAIPEKLLEGAEEAILQCAYLVLGLAQVHVRVDTGSLRDSGRIERGGQSMHFRQVKVRFGGYVTNPKTGRLVDYAAIVEAQYPYLKVAVHESESEVRDIINRVCLASVGELSSVSVG